jgi:SAM-dependent methyltransferase
VENNPQVKQMADESMVRNLSAQATAIWPQEEPIMRGHGSPREILDVGCGTGEISARMARLWPQARIVGVDLIDAHLELARQRYGAELGDRLTFQHADAFALPFADARFDLVVARHLLQAVPNAEQVVVEMLRVLRPGGKLHLLVEDYDMIHAAPARLDVGSFWHVAPRVLAGALGVNNHIGRHAYGILNKLPVDDIRVDYAIVDTQRVPRDVFAQIFEAWRDGYAEDLAKYMGLPLDDVRDHFEATIECIRDGYAVWFVPIVTARKR